MDLVGLKFPFVLHTFASGGTGRPHRVGGICRLVGVLQKSRLGYIAACRREVPGRVNGADGKVHGLKDGQVEILGLLQRRRSRHSHFVMDGRMLACTVGSRAGDMAQMGKDACVQMNGMLQIERNVGAEGQALGPKEQVQQCRKVGMCQASANLYRDMPRIKVNVDNNAQLMV